MPHRRRRWPVRDGSDAIGARTDVLQQAEEAIGRVGQHGRCPEWSTELLSGNAEEAIAKMSMCAQFGAQAGPGMRCPGQEDGVVLDFVAEIGGVECWFDVIMLDGELVLLEDNDRSTMLQDALFEYGRAMSREIVARVSERIGRLSAWDRQTVAVICDPMRSIARYGGLEEALEELGKRCAWLSAVALAGDERLEIHDVPGSANPLDERVREGMLRLHDRRLLAMDAAGGAGREG